MYYLLPVPGIILILRQYRTCNKKQSTRKINSGRDSQENNKFGVRCIEVRVERTNSQLRNPSWISCAVSDCINTYWYNNTTVVTTVGYTAVVQCTSSP